MIALDDPRRIDWDIIPRPERYRVDTVLACALVGSAATVHDGLADLSRRLSPDEVMAVTDLTDPAVTSPRTPDRPASSPPSDRDRRGRMSDQRESAVRR